MSGIGAGMIVFPGLENERRQALETADNFVRMIGARDPERLVEGLLERLRVVVETDPARQPRLRLSAYDARRRRVMLRQGLSRGERLGAVARELGYLMLYPEHLRSAERPSRRSEARKDAVEVFVRAILMPEPALRAAFARHGGVLAAVAGEFDVAPEDVVFRVADLPDQG